MFKLNYFYKASQTHSSDARLSVTLFSAGQRVSLSYPAKSRLPPRTPDKTPYSSENLNPVSFSKLTPFKCSSRKQLLHYPEKKEQKNLTAGYTH